MFGGIEIDETSYSNIVCTKCSDGLYLYSNTSNSENYPDLITSGVPDCRLVDTRLTNNIATRQCESCGDACLAGSSTFGCESGEGYETSHSIVDSFALNPTGEASVFSTCTRGYSLNNAGETGNNITGNIECSSCLQTVDESGCSTGVSTDSGDAEGNGNGEIGPGGFYLSATNTGSSGDEYENGGYGNSNKGYEGETGYSFSSDYSGSVEGFESEYYEKDGAEGTEEFGQYIIYFTGNRCHKDLIYQPNTTSINSIGCVTACNIDQYVEYSLVSNEFGRIYDQRTGRDGNSNNCYECVGSESNQCKSGLEGSYLSLNDGSTLLGTGVEMTTSIVSITLFVTPNDEDDNADGSYSTPYGNIVKALKVSEELASEFTDAIVNICLLSGDHYMTRNQDHYVYQQR